MNKHHSNWSIIEKKLEQLPVADADLLWNDMHLILDENMPQKKERRRFIAWFLSGQGLFLLTFSSLIITSSALFFISTQKNTIGAPGGLSSSQQTNTIIKNDEAKTPRSNNESIKTNNDPSPLLIENTMFKGTSVSPNYVVNNKAATEYSKQPPGPEASITQGEQPSNSISIKRENSRVDLVNSRPGYQDPQIAAVNNNKKISISQPLGTGVSKTINGRNEKGFYGGIMMGADFSSVKFQPAKTGATMGFILGYALDQRWSIESGLLWDTKRVYDGGTYFNPPGYSPTNGITITAVNGKSRLHEWPINVRYSVKSRNHSFFAITGVSSYFMKLENFDYEYTQNNQPGGHNYLSYKNETKDWFGVINVGLGYSHKLGANGNIRIEPYFKLPVTNIGTANMPIMSTGLNIGITKPLRR